MTPPDSYLQILRERIAFWIAPWLQRRYSEQYDRAFADLAEVAYGKRDAIWTSPTTLVHVALREARMGRDLP